MKKIYNYRVYLLVSLTSLLLGGLSNIIQGDSDSETFALIAFVFFTIAVAIVAIDEFFVSRPNVLKKLRSISLVWKK